MKLLIDSATRRVHTVWNDGDGPSAAPDGFVFVTIPGVAKDFVWPHRGTRGHTKLDTDDKAVFEPPIERRVDALVSILKNRPLFFSGTEQSRLDAAD